MITSQYFNITSNASVFASNRHIANKQHCSVWVKSLSNVWTQIPYNDYDLVNNSIILNNTLLSTIYSQVELRVADSQEELGTPVTDISTTASIRDEVIVVADNISDITTVADNIVNLNSIADNIVKAGAVADNMNSVVIVANDLTNINIVASNKTNIDIAASNITEIQNASANSSIATAKAFEASASAASAYDSSTIASNSEIKANKWADNNYNVEVETGKYSAKHWAIVSQNYVGVKVVESIAELKTLSNADANQIEVLGYYAKGDGGGGLFYLDSTSTESDNGGTIIQATGITTGRWKRVFSGAVNVKWFGAKGDGVTDDTVAIQNAIDNFNSIFAPKGTYNISAETEISNVTITGEEGTIFNLTSNVNMFVCTTILSNTQTCSISTSTIVGSSNTVNKTVITPASIASFAVGDKIYIRGTNSQSLCTTISSIDGSSFIIPDIVTYTLASPSVSKIGISNITIDNIKFSSVELTGGKYIISGGVGVTVKNCDFSHASSAISLQYGFHDIENNIFNDNTLNIQLYECDHSIVKNNIIKSFGAGIRCVRCSNLKILNNTLMDGTNLLYGIGIELTGESELYDKNCHNLVDGNTILSANKGTPGSGIGGIHLNFNGNYNKIVNNKSWHNSFGIYLENNNNFNLIQGNDCSYNDGWYGVGIELDWDNDNNIVDSNICSYNNGSISASESSGIILRNRTDHPNNYNIITNNNIFKNGLDGIRIDGNYTTISGNIIIDNSVYVSDFNSSIPEAIGCGIAVSGDNNLVANNTIKHTSWDRRASNLFSQKAVYIIDSTNTIVSNNIIDAGYYCNSGIFIYNDCSNISIRNNNINSATAEGRAIQAYGLKSGSSSIDNLYTEGNIISAFSNGSNAIEFYYVDKYSAFGNILSGTSNTTAFISCTNRYTPINN